MFLHESTDRIVRLIKYIPFTSLHLNSIYKRDLRKACKGYYISKNTNGIKFIEKIKNGLSLVEFNLPIKEQSRFKKLYGSEFCLSTCLKQYVKLKIQSHRFTLAILESIATNKNIVFPLPSQYQSYLNQNGLPVDKTKSTFLWNIYLILEILFGLHKSLEYLSFSIYSFIKRDYKKFIFKDCFFEGLTYYTFPNEDHNNDEYDTPNWFYNTVLKSKTKLNFSHDFFSTKHYNSSKFSLTYQKYPFYYLTRVKKIFNLSIFLCSQIVSLPYFFLKGYWWRLLLTSELFWAQAVLLQESKYLAKKYYFHTTPSYRPIWTYPAKSKGSRIFCFFYSTNIQGYLTHLKFHRVKWFWKDLTWPEYYAWDIHHEDFIREASALGNEFSIVQTGPIPAQSSSIFSPLLIPSNSISIFDVTPQRFTSFITLGEPNEMHTPKYMIKFLKDIIEECNKRNLYVLHKQKRPHHIVSHPLYNNFLKNILNYPNLISVPPDTSAFHVVQNTKLVISYPYTSVSHIAKSYSKPTCFYDPSESLNSEDKAAHSIKIVKGIESLRLWIDTYM